MLVPTVGLRKRLLACALVCCMAVFMAGCKDDVFTINFTGNPLYGVEDLPVTFSATATAVAPYEFEGDEDKFRGDLEEPNVLRVISYFWEFGDGSTGSGQNPTHLYTDPGLYTVTLTVTVQNVTTGKFYVCDLTRVDYVEVIAANGPPVADAGPNIIAGPRDTVNPDGSGSYDPDDDVLSYFWEVISAPGGLCAEGEGEGEGMYEGSYDLTKGDGPPPCFINDKGFSEGEVEGFCEGEFFEGEYECPACSYFLDNETSVSPDFNAFCVGEYVLRLTVTTIDGTDTDEMTVTFSFNDPPIADAGDDQSVASGPVTLDGRESSDPNDDPLTYVWRIISQPSCKAKGGGANIVDYDEAVATLNPVCDGTYVLSLTVDDGEFSDTDEITVVVDSGETNTPPLADAGAYDTICFIVPNKAHIQSQLLDGSGSSDGDSDPITYLWSLISAPVGSNAYLSNANTVTPTLEYIDEQGSYVVQLIVNDGTANSVPVTATIVYGNCPPTADAGDDQSVFQWQLAVLNGTGSNDPNFDPLTYSWSIISASIIYSGDLIYCLYELYNATSSIAAFAAVCPGTYVIELTVNDGDFEDKDTVTITVNPGTVPGKAD